MSFERLPRTIIPLHYDVNIKPHIDESYFEGKLELELEILEKTQIVALNNVQIFIGHAALLPKDRPPEDAIEPKSVKTFEDQEIVYIEFTSIAEPGYYTLILYYEGLINTSLKGFVRSTYINDEGKICFMGITQFEPCGARRVIPCFDEPDFKATFDITIVAEKKYEAISNMPVKRQESVDDLYTKTVFETTPTMSTYLLAFAITEYSKIEASADDVKIQIYAPKEKVDLGKTALDIAVKVLDFFKSYFCIPYTLPKLDFICLTDFAEGAMENWGLITCREELLLISEDSLSVNKERVNLIIAHEIAHQWFGNLVTMDWWTHLWLNEGYATFMEYLSISHIYPELQIMSTFFVQHYYIALDLDALSNTHPIEVEINDPYDVDERFDDISYAKSACVIRMLHHYLGDCDFRRGMFLYLEWYKMKNASSDNLWFCLEVATKKPVKQIMENWTKTQGYPVINVTSEFKEDGILLSFTQRRFFIDDKCYEIKPAHWAIPIGISTPQHSKETKYLLESDSGEVFIPNVAYSDWVKVNSKHFGFYRVNYSSEMLNNLKKGIESKTLPWEDRLGLQNDIFNLARAGFISTVEYIKFIKMYREETEPTVWLDLCYNLIALCLILSDTECEEEYHEFVIKLLSTMKERLGWDPKKNEQPSLNKLRTWLLQCLILCNDPKTISEAKFLYNKHMGNGPKLPVDMHEPVFKAVIRDGCPVDKFFNMYTEEVDPDMKNLIISAISFSKNPTVIKRLLDFMLSDKMKLQDKIMVFVHLKRQNNCKMGQICFEFLKRNEQFFRKTFESTPFMSIFVQCFQNMFMSLNEAFELENYIRDANYTGVGTALKQTLEVVRNNADWKQRDYKAIHKYFFTCQCQYF